MADTTTAKAATYHDAQGDGGSRRYLSKLPPRQPQADALEKMRGKGAFALLMAMRTGKTKVALDDFGRLELTGQVRDLLVIAPGGVYKTWAKAWVDHVSTDLQSRAAIHVWEAGGRTTLTAKAAQAAWLAHVGPRVLLMNVEALSTVKDARELCEAFADSRGACMVIIDESTCIKNPKALRSKWIVETLAPLTKVRRILSGLPTPRSPLDIYMQFRFLNPYIIGIRNYYAFKHRYAIVRSQRIGGRMIELVVGYQNQDELRKKIEDYSHRVEFRPNIPSTYTIDEIKMTPQQQVAYAKMKAVGTFEIANAQHVTATIVITQILKLHQILCGFVKDEDGTLHTLPEYRTARLLEVLDKGGTKAVIWCSYDYNVQQVSAKLAKEYGEFSVARFWGGNVRTREEEERRFLNDANCQFMVATPNAGGKGRTWSCADLVVYYSSTNDLELRDQSEQRVQGVEKTRQVDYYDLIVPGTVESKILHALRNKMNLAASITGANWRDWVV